MQLAQQIEREFFEREYGALYVSDVGRPGIPTRVLVGLHYLKHAYGESDESVVARWVENPYWQYFCGYEYLQHEVPCHPTALVKWRQRLESDGIEKMLQALLATTSKSNWVVAAQARHGNPYDGVTLKGTINQVEKLTGHRPQEATCDRG